MPSWLRQLLENDGKSRTVNEPSRMGRPPKVRTIQNHISGIIPVVQQLLGQDPTTQYAYTCHPCVQHVFKLQNEGRCIKEAHEFDSNVEVLIKPQAASVVTAIYK